MSKQKNNGWEASWRGITNTLKEIDWAGFRDSNTVCERLQDGKSLTEWKRICAKAAVPDKLKKRSLFGTLKNNAQELTADSLRIAYYIHTITNTLNIQDTPLRVLEVGAGYCGFAEQFCRNNVVAKYYLLDTPVMQILQGYYMIKTGHGQIISFEHPEGKVDLIVSTNTLGEMFKPTVDKYVKLFTEVLRPKTGLMFLVQRENTGGHITTRFDDYGFDKTVWDISTKPHPRSPQHQIEVFGRLI